MKTGTLLRLNKDVVNYNENNGPLYEVLSREAELPGLAWKEGKLYMGLFYQREPIALINGGLIQEGPKKVVNSGHPKYTSTSVSSDDRTRRAGLWQSTLDWSILHPNPKATRS